MLFAHVHFGQPGVNGGIFFFFVVVVHNTLVPRREQLVKKHGHRRRCNGYLWIRAFKLGTWQVLFGQFAVASPTPTSIRSIFQTGEIRGQIEED